MKEFKEVSDKVPVHPDYQIYVDEWELMRDSIRGNTKIKSKTEKYLPAPNNINATGAVQNIRNSSSRITTAYQRFQMLTDFPELTSQALKGMIGLAFSEDSVIELSNSTADLEFDATGKGDNFNSLYNDILSEVMTMGRVGVLVSVDTELNPFFQLYSTENILNWSIGDHNNLHSVLLRDFSERFNQETFTYEQTPEYIGLNLNEEGLYTQTRFDKDFNPIESQVVSWGFDLGHIPFYILTPYKVNSELRDSILSPIAHKCLQIYRNTAILNKSLATKGDPTFYMLGINVDEVEHLDMGANNFIALRNPSAKVGYAEIDGAGSQSLRDQILDDIRVAQAYAGKLFDGGGAGESGESLKQRRLMAEISLTSVIDSLSIQLTHILQETAFTLKDVNYLDNRFQGFKNFTSKIESIDDLLKASGLIPQGVISKESIHELAAKSGLTELNYEEEQERISNESGGVGL